MNNRGFTLIESLVSLILASFLVLTVVQLSVLVSDVYTTAQERESLDSVAISWIEQQRFSLDQSGVLDETRDTLTGSIGTLQYTLIGEVAPLDYEGAYRLNVTVKSLNTSTTNEVILYA